MAVNGSRNFDETTLALGNHEEIDELLHIIVTEPFFARNFNMWERPEELRNSKSKLHEYKMYSETGYHNGQSALLKRWFDPLGVWEPVL
jgi:hypothetical protein